MKLKYYTLTKEEKIKLKNEFYVTNIGKNIKLRLTRLLIIGIFGIIFSIFLYIDSKSTWNYVYSTILLLTSIFFILASFTIKIRKLNSFLINKK